MALPWALAILSLLPVLDAQSPACLSFSMPITNASLDQISGKWFFIADAARSLEYKMEANESHAFFVYLTPIHTEDRIQLKQYMTFAGECIYDSTHLRVHRENATLTTYENGTQYFGHLLLPKDPKTFMLATLQEDKKELGLSLFADKPEVTPEQMEQFYDYLKCMGMDKSEVLYTNQKKNMCLQLEKQHEEERRKKKEKSETGSALD